jgi:hypothetical protein
LVRLIETVLAQVAQVEPHLRQRGSPCAVALADLLVQYVPLVRQVLEQTARRVLQGQSVPAANKIVSLFEPHTTIIQRGKAPPQALAVLNNLVLGLLRRRGVQNVPQARRRYNAHLQEAVALVLRA